jgi:dihydroorotate dehydrogenase (NAD+) catalytic subunit
MKPLLLSNGKRDFQIDPPWMNSAGVLGVGFEAGRLFPLEWLGALVTPPLSRTQRSPSAGQRWMEFPGGMLLHTGHPQPGLETILREQSRRWKSVGRPIIAHLLAQEPDDLQWMVQRLEEVEAIGAVEVGLSPDLSAGAAAELLDAAVHGDLPVIACLPPAQALALAEAASAGGAAAVSLAPVRGSLPAPGGGLAAGRLYGPALLPQALWLVGQLSGRLECPLIGSGGLFSRQAARAMLACGAQGLQIDSALWTFPELLLDPSGEARHPLSADPASPAD